MPRPKRQRPAYQAPRSIAASAATITPDTMARPRDGSQPWQQEGWYFYDTCGEYRFGVNWLANACSRVTLTIVEDDGEGESLVTEGPEVEALAELAGGPDGQSQLLGTFGQHFTVAGETYLIGEDLADTSDPFASSADFWQLYSNEEVNLSRSGLWTVECGDGNQRTLDPATSTVIRMWRPHPRKRIEADSPTRAVLPILRELEGLTQSIAASLDSRLAGAGVFLVPNEMTVGNTGQMTDAAALFGPDAPPPTMDPLSDPIMQQLVQAMIASRSGQGSAAALAPVLLKGPGQWLDKAKHITFATPLDEKALELRTEAIRRLGLGLDMPPEVLTGLADANHWSAWQIDENGIKIHIEPFMETATAALTDRWLRWALRAVGRVLPENRRIGFDTSALRSRPDRKAEAVELYDRLELNGRALRRETGFEESDAPSSLDVEAQLLAKLALAGGTPEAAVAAAQQLGVDLGPLPSSDPAAQATPPPPAEPAPSGNNSPPEAPPEAPPAQAASARPMPHAVTASADLIAMRALEKANNRVNNRGKQLRRVDTALLDMALKGAFDEVPRIAAIMGVDPDMLTSVLDTYCRAALTEATGHQPNVLAKLLRHHLVMARLEAV